MTGNMDKTPVIFDMMPEKSLLEKGQKSVAIQTPGSEKRHVTVVLTVAADGSILPPMTWFRDKTNQTIKDIEALGIRVSFLCAKTKVAPLKKLSIPRLKFIRMCFVE